METLSNPNLIRYGSWTHKNYSKLLLLLLIFQRQNIRNISHANKSKLILCDMSSVLNVYFRHIEVIVLKANFGEFIY